MPEKVHRFITALAFCGVYLTAVATRSTPMRVPAHLMLLSPLPFGLSTLIETIHGNSPAAAFCPCIIRGVIIPELFIAAVETGIRSARFYFLYRWYARVRFTVKIGHYVDP